MGILSLALLLSHFLFVYFERFFTNTRPWSIVKFVSLFRQTDGNRVLALPSGPVSNWTFNTWAVGNVNWTSSNLRWWWMDACWTGGIEIVPGTPDDWWISQPPSVLFPLEASFVTTLMRMKCEKRSEKRGWLTSMGIGRCGCCPLFMGTE